MPGIALVPLLLLVVLTLIVAGCNPFSGSTEMPAERQVMPALEFDWLRDYRGVVDCRVDGAAQDQIADTASQAQLDFVFLAGHLQPGQTDFGTAGFTGAVLFIPGASFEIPSGGEMLALNLYEGVEPYKDAASLIESIHRQYAIAVASDLGGFKSADAYASADGVEVYNFSATEAAAPTAGFLFRAWFLPEAQALAAFDHPSYGAIAQYDRMTHGTSITMIAGHGLGTGRSVIGARLGTFAHTFSLFTTHILAPEREIGPLVEGLKRGHSYVSFDLISYVPNFAFYAQSGDQRTMMGDEVAFNSQNSPPLKLKAELPAPADRIELVGNGAVVASGAGSQFEYAPQTPGAYRVQAYRKGYLWILSNPVYLR